MLYILSGQDDYSINESLRDIKNSISNQTLLEVNTTVLEGHEITTGQLRGVCETPPFLAEKRLVIIKGLLERFEPANKARYRQKTKQRTNKQNEYKSLSDSMNHLPDSTILVLISGRINNRNPLFTELSTKAKVKFFPLLRGDKLLQWIQNYVKKNGGTISPNAVNLMAQLIGSNLWIMSNEVTKLILFVSNRCIEEKDVRLVVSHAQEDNVFAMVDAIIEFKVGLAERLLHQLLIRGASPSYLLVMLSRQVRMIIRLKELRNQERSEMEIRNKLRLTADFTWQKLTTQATRYPLVRIKKVYQKLLEADLSIKTGKYEGELALNILIAELSQ
ncbi:MAG: DNA polymerase III subunit delta [Dehalococcoidales bacterium]|nr:DNA polymerase III subunit delta [Dehalococcoidales bacterium]